MGVIEFCDICGCLAVSVYFRCGEFDIQPGPIGPLGSLVPLDPRTLGPSIHLYLCNTHALVVFIYYVLIFLNHTEAYRSTITYGKNSRLLCQLVQQVCNWK